MTEPPARTSQRWGSTTKLVVALTMVAMVAALLIQFRYVLSPFLIALVLAYLFQPVADLVQRTGLSWRASVSVIYVVVLLLLLGLLTLSGVSLVQQIQSVIVIAQASLEKLPAMLQDLSGQVVHFGPFSLDFTRIDLNVLSSQVLGMVQPLLSRTGNLLSTAAGGAASFLGWTFFVLIVSYFMLAESGGLRARIITVDIPNYREDVARLGRDLGRIWNAFLRGQIIIFFLTLFIYTIVLSVLGVHYAIGLAFLAGLARFVPYIGPAINWTILVLVTYFQSYKLFGLDPVYYSLIVLGVALVIDQIFDNLVSPRILSDALKVHPAGVLVSAIISASLLGIVGVVIAAPALATVTLFGRYAVRKLLDLDPFPEPEARHPPPPPGSRLLASARRLWRKLRPPHQPQA